jgi:hypothetical protein
VDVIAGAVGHDGELILVGAYEGTLDLGTSAGALPAAGTRTAFVARLAP